MTNFNNNIVVVNDVGEFLVNPTSMTTSYEYPDACLFSSEQDAIRAAYDALQHHGFTWDVVEYYGQSNERVVAVIYD